MVAHHIPFPDEKKLLHAYLRNSVIDELIAGMRRVYGILLASVLASVLGFPAIEVPVTNENPLRMPLPGDNHLRILSPTLLEITLITTKFPDPAPVTSWNFVTNGIFVPPNLSQLIVTVDAQSIPIQAIGFKRRPIYAPLVQRDLRIGNYLYLQLAQPLVDGQSVRVDNPDGTLWNSNQPFTATVDPLRWNPAIHVNQQGYLLGFSKKAMIGEYLGSLGEMDVDPGLGFNLIETISNTVVYQGALTSRPDIGYNPPAYQKVLEADFTPFDVPGEYRLQIPGLGVSFPFLIGHEVAALFARTYSLGLYHQRCGVANDFPYTRFTHGPCHTGLVEVPNMNFTTVNAELASFTQNYASNPRHTAPRLKDVNSSRYPFVNTNKLDVSGGHHDAGDYSKYTINSAQLAHALIFAVDVFPGVAELDNLGLPESGDGIPDLLQEAKQETDFLAKMQDADGGFYFLVYPRNRSYEYDVLPDHGDPQVVFPKNTAATAAAVAALAQTASSPIFRAYYPDEADLYLQKALAGWAFLQNAIATYGRDGSYQMITHYGDNFMHDDELAWAATELFLATGDPAFQDDLIAHFDPSSSATRLWTWWRLFEGYGCAVRSYAFAAQTGRIDPSQLDMDFLAKCNAEISGAGDDQLQYALDNAYGSSFPDANKGPRTAGWYFSVNQTFDLATAYQLNPRPEYLEAIVGNMNYEAGCNPININFLTGIGQLRQREIVHQYAQNDRRVLPPSGLPLGNIQQGFAYLDPYKTELSALCFPGDYGATNFYAPYDKWGDSFNTMTEFVGPQQARSLASMAFLMAQTPEKFEPWNSADGTILDVPDDTATGDPIVARFFNGFLDLTNARIVWEAEDQEPALAPEFHFSPVNPGLQWIEAEVTLPNGRRLFATKNFNASLNSNRPANPFQSEPLSVTSDMAALYHLDSDFTDTTGQQTSLTNAAAASLDTLNRGWMREPEGTSLHSTGAGDTATTLIRNNSLKTTNTTKIVVEAMIYVHARPTIATAPFLSLVGNWNASLELVNNRYIGFVFRGGTNLNFSTATVQEAFTLNQWHHVHMEINSSGYLVMVDGVTLTQVPSNELKNWPTNGSATLTLGNFDGWLDEVVIKSMRGSAPLRLIASSTANQQLKITLQGNIGAGFILQSSTDLLNWTPVLTNLLQNTNYDYLDNNPASTRRFFRAISTP